MHKLLSVLAALACTASLALPASAEVITIVGGTQLMVHLVDPLSSGSAHAGDVVAIAASDDLVVDGWIVVAKGALGQADVTTVEGAGGNGHSGALGLKFDWVYGTDGMKIKLADAASHAGEHDKKGASSTATIATYALLGPVGFFAHNFVKGKNATIEPTKALPCFVDTTVHINAKVQAHKAADGFAH